MAKKKKTKQQLEKEKEMREALSKTGLVKKGTVIYKNY